jgi:cation diffusion facilitator CzcD-associated flavoprotein CzcO
MTADVLVIGAGPYGLAAAAAARGHGLQTTIVGQPMAFWREHMPAEMFLRSGPDWHLDPAGSLTLERYLELRGIAPADVDPLPIRLFLEYADWFRETAGIVVRDERVVALTHDGDFCATLDSGRTLRARAVVAAPGVSHFTHRPEWAGGLGEHTCDLVDFKDLSGARVVIVGGRQSAYEWAALLGEHGAERIDVVHRHAAPRFDRVSWRFVDPLVESTLRERGWWRNLSASERGAVDRRFWEVGRLTLEHWLAPRLARAPVRVRPHAEVVCVEPAGERVDLRLSDGARLDADRIVFACGYRADIARVPYLAGVLDEVQRRAGFPVLDEAMGSTLPGLYLPGFSATQDFGPFFGFVKGAPAAGTLVAGGIAQRLDGR